MVIVYGTRLFGEVDKAPDVGAVSTRFFHIYYVPLVPLGSYFVPSGHTDLGCRVPMSPKSILVAWARAAAIFSLATAITWAAVAYGENELSEALRAGVMAAMAFGVFDLLRITPGVGRASQSGADRMRQLRDSFVGVERSPRSATSWAA